MLLSNIWLTIKLTGVVILMIILSIIITPFTVIRSYVKHWWRIEKDIWAGVRHGKKV